MANLKQSGIKRDWSAVPVELLEAIVDVFQHGNDKYERDNWQQNATAKPHEYISALYRHVAAYRKGQVIDDDSGLPHLAHAATNAMILMWLDNHNANNATKRDNKETKKCRSYGWR